MAIKNDGSTILSEFEKSSAHLVPSINDLKMSTELPTTINVLSTISSAYPQQLRFTLFDYSFFVGLLVLSALIGIWYGFFSKNKQNNTKEYLLGGKKMHTFPISVSLIASHISGISLLGIPIEIYSNGTQYWAFIVPAFAVAFSMTYIYLPVFYELQLTSCFSYLEKRFDRNVRIVASFVFAISCIVFMPIVIYVPALAFSQVSGVNIYYITPIICIICIFYTTIGGLRAVVMTDTLQFFLMMGAILSVIYMGIAEVGGIGEVWAAAARGNRLQFFNMDPSPFIRTSFWTVCFGLTTTWISNLGVNQSCVQRFLAVPDIKKARQSVWVFTAGLLFIKSFTCVTGLLIYAKYETCDPFSAGIVKKQDQVFPYYVMDVAGSIPGLPGLFIAGIFAAALSSLSSVLNTLAGTIYEDFIRHRLPAASEEKASSIMKVLVVLLGCLQLALVFIVEKLGTVFQVALSLGGITSGALLGMFTMGMLCRNANTKGVICGTISSVVLVTSIMIGAQQSKKKVFGLPMRTDGCVNITSVFLNTTTQIPPQPDVPEVFWAFRISFMYYSLIGFLIVFIVGYPISLLTGGNKDLDEILLTPLIRSKEYKRKTDADNKDVQYMEVDKAVLEMKVM